MLEVTSSFYKEKMGNISSITKSPVTKPTKSSDLESSLISDSVNHASCSQLNSSSSLSSVKGCDSKTSDHCSESCNSSTLFSEEEEEEEDKKELPINDSKKTSKEPNNCEIKSDLLGKSEENSSAIEEKGNNVKVTAIPSTSALKQWNDYQQPSTSKAKVITFIHNPKDISSEETEEEETETFSEGDFDEESEAQYNYDDDDEHQFFTQIHHNHLEINMTKRKSLNKFNLGDDMDDDVQFYGEEDGCQAIGDLSKLLEHLVSHNSIGPRSRKAICDDTDSDSDYENSNGPANNVTSQIMPATNICKEDLGELGIPRTQKITKNGDPVVEKCNCYHHQIVATK